MTVEEQIKATLAGGDHRAAATEALRAYGPKILGYLQAVLRDEADAADAFSIFAEHLWRGLPTWRGQSSLKTWAFKLAWNAALNLKDEAWRRRGRRFKTGEASRLAEEIRTRTGLRVERQRQALDGLRAELTEEEQTLLVLRIDQQLAWEEIAEVMAVDDVPVDSAALRKRFERLKEKLTRLAKDRGLV
ncbi:MAG: sigma-70 family RNA polymerase sigma factor [Anaeromyxobacter sp.]|nr:sigma-70 family RNA polymerase sigma factor [Anaeromyxobacter sp.]MBL0275066.1 sigma-70 family RNA polymerase sigma factor [Anaeromyxobacter sp.]